MTIEVKVLDDAAEVFVSVSVVVNEAEEERER